MLARWELLATPDLAINRDECLCLLFNIDEISQTSIERWLSRIMPSEQDAAENFAKPNDRKRFVATRFLLRKYLKLVFGQEPIIEENEYGKPFLVNQDGQFNVSHSGNFLLMAFSYIPIGVDIEKIVKFSEMKYIKDNLYHPGERDEINNVQMNQSDLWFFICWTRKEALLKAIGKGLTIKTESFQVSCDPNKADLHHSPDPYNQWRILNTPPIDENYVSSLCIGGTLKTIKFRSVNI